MKVFFHITPAPLFAPSDNIQFPMASPSDNIQFPMASPSVRDSINLNITDDVPFQAKMQPDSWFLTQTQSLMGKTPAKVRKTLYFRRSSDLLMDFQMPDPYVICAAYLFLERDDDVLANMNILTMNMLLCSMRKLPWNMLDVYDHGQAFQEGTADYTLQYPYHFCENAEDENLPDSTAEEGNLLTEGQLFYLASGYALPRNQRPSSKLKKWFEDQGVPAERAEGMAWGAWIASCFDELQEKDLSDNQDGIEESEASITEVPEESEEPETPETPEEQENRIEDYAARMAELTRQLKAAQKVVHEAERNNLKLQKQLQETEAESMQD